MAVGVLAYHSQNCNGNDYENNDHVAFRHDLGALSKRGVEIVTLKDVVDALLERSMEALPGNCVALSCDDGTVMDWKDYNHPDYGLQPAMAGILREHQRVSGSQRKGMLTSFVIACPEARRVIDHGCYEGQRLSEDDWWSEALDDGLVDIGNHSFDHLHPVLSMPGRAGERLGDFPSVDTYELCDHQVREAREMIQRIIARDGFSAELYAYPFGQCSDYMKDEYFPDNVAEHGTRAAFTTEQAFIYNESNRYALPRLVCGDAWNSADEFDRLLDILCSH